MNFILEVKLYFCWELFSNFYCSGIEGKDFTKLTIKYNSN